MVVESSFRERVRREGAEALNASLSEREVRRLLALASDRGLQATRLVHKDFRLSKLYIMLPLTRFLLGRERMLREVHLFWEENLPVTHYLLEEAIEFCDFLLRRLDAGRLRLKYLAEVVAYERAELELKRPRPQRLPPSPQRVRFRHHPASLLTALARRRVPRAIPVCECTLVATLDSDGQVQWAEASDD